MKDIYQYQEFHSITGKSFFSVGCSCETFLEHLQNSSGAIDDKMPSGFIITPEGNFLTIQSENDHAPYFVEYINLYLQLEEKNKYVIEDWYQAYNKINQTGHIICFKHRKFDAVPCFQYDFSYPKKEDRNNITNECRNAYFKIMALQTYWLDQFDFICHRNLEKNMHYREDEIISDLLVANKVYKR